jgi:hypothetical protein
VPEGLCLPSLDYTRDLRTLVRRRDSNSYLQLKSPYLEKAVSEIGCAELYRYTHASRLGYFDNARLRNITTVHVLPVTSFRHSLRLFAALNTGFSLTLPFIRVAYPVSVSRR